MISIPIAEGLKFYAYIPHLVDFFFHPVLRAPSLSCMLIGCSASLIGVLLYLKKNALIGETLSHASYPGITLAAIVASYFFPLGRYNYPAMFTFLIGALASASLGYFLVNWLQKKKLASSDTALCFVLSSLFGVGLTLASYIQFSHTDYYKQIDGYIFGQAATMTDFHTWLYASISCSIAAFLFFFFKEIQTITFDPEYAKTTGIRHRLVENIFFFLVVFTVVTGIRSVGVVLMSALLIAPVITARQFTCRLHTLLMLSGACGMVNGFLGNYLAVSLPFYLQDTSLRFPTGPMVVLTSATFALAALMLAPNSGLFMRLWRIFSFRYRCTQENLLKGIWKSSEPISFTQLTQVHALPKWLLYRILKRLRRDGWIMFCPNNTFQLTEDGRKKAENIVRLHRLWEVYLTEYLQVGAERVHKSAEEMEHILSPELEEQLTELLNDPKKDPHFQPIPPRRAS